MINLTEHRQTSEEVYHSLQSRIQLERGDMQRLITAATQTVRKRARFCIHKDAEESIQEMFIVHPQDAYVRPHKHIHKPESMTVIDGEVDFITFHNNGEIADVIRMADYSSGKIFYNSMRADIYHSLVIRSQWLTFLEFTAGPFKREDTVFAPWSPEENDTSGVSIFLEKLKQGITT